MSNSLKTAVLLLIFNRPDKTAQVFEKIRQVKPLKLYVACDGPREGIKGEKEKVTMAQAIATNVDWPCNVKKLFREKNLGCKRGVGTAVTWFFQNEEQGIILEDDCMPHIDFFAFCENLLNRYAKDKRVSVITGNNFQKGKWRGEASYYFSTYNHCWGWASWKRAWKQYQEDINFWPEMKFSHAWKKFKTNNSEREYWEKNFDQSYAGQIDTWDYSWTASTWYKNGVTATPNVNLVSNIGFGEEATHTKEKFNKCSNLPTYALSHITHPKEVKIDKDADKFTFRNVFQSKYSHFPFNWLLLPFRIFNYIVRKIINK